MNPSIVINKISSLTLQALQDNFNIDNEDNEIKERKFYGLTRLHYIDAGWQENIIEVTQDGAVLAGKNRIIKLIKQSEVKKEGYEYTYLNNNQTKAITDCLCETLPNMEKIFNKDMRGQKHEIIISIMAYLPSFEKNWSGPWHSDTYNGDVILPITTIVYFGHQNVKACLSLRPQKEITKVYTISTYTGLTLSFDNKNLAHRVHDVSAMTTKPSSRYLHFSIKVLIIYLFRFEFRCLNQLEFASD